MCERHGVSIRQGCKAVSLPRSTYCYRRKPKDEQPIIDELLTLAFIQPGKPMQNGYIERLNGSIHRELLNAYVFRTIQEVRQKAEQWKHDYNWRRPHSSLDYKTPMGLLKE